MSNTIFAHCGVCVSINSYGSALGQKEYILVEGALIGNLSGMVELGSLRQIRLLARFAPKSTDCHALRVGRVLTLQL